MKAILVIDMPKDCTECPLSDYGECDALGGKYDGRCPLKSAKDFIPIEWIKEWNEILTEQNTCGLEQVVDTMLTDWEIENDTTD